MRYRVIARVNTIEEHVYCEASSPEDAIKKAKVWFACWPDKCKPSISCGSCQFHMVTGKMEFECHCAGDTNADNKYLVIFEDGSPSVIDRIDEDLMSSLADGYVCIYNMETRQEVLVDTDNPGSVKEVGIKSCSGDK